MTTASWSTVLDQSTDAGFRAWGSELAAKFAAVGMVQTSDTGQINWASVTRAAVINTAAGYEIWRLSGSALYFKIEYGTGSVQPTTPSLWLTVGTGSNGSGTITGQTSTRTQVGRTSTAISSTVTNYQSYLCATADYFGLSWKLGSSATVNSPRALIVVARTVDNTGAASTTGYAVYLVTTSSFLSTQCVATAAAVTQAAATSNCSFIIPGSGTAITTSSDGAGDVQAFIWWYAVYGSTPVQPLLHITAALLSELAVGLTAPMTLVGTTPHTYLSCATSVSADAGGTMPSANLGLLILWE